MKAELIKKENAMATIQMTIDAETYVKAEQQAYQKTKGKYQIPGFRKGKATKGMLEQYYGKGLFMEEAVNICIPEAYEAAIVELGLDPVDKPEIDVKDVGLGQDLVIEAVVALKPEFELPAYKGISVEKFTVEVTEEQVEKELERTRDMNARIITVEDRPIQDGDTAIIDYKGFVGDHQFEGGTADNHSLVIGSHSFIDTFEEQLIGANIGDSLDVNVTFPAEYHSEELKGQAAVFKVTIKEIKAKELPELNDEFAQDTSEFDTLVALKADIKEKLIKSAEGQADNENRERVVKAVVDGVSIDVPHVMADNEANGMLRDFDYQLRYQGLSLDQYIQFSGGSLDELKERMMDDAKERVKTSLVLESIIKAENLKANEEEVETELQRIAETQKTAIEEVRKIYGRDNFEYLKNAIESRKAVDFLVENANFNA